MSSQIFGNIIGARIITRTFGPTFFIIMGMIIIFALLCLFFLKVPKKFDYDLPDNL